MFKPQVSGVSIHVMLFHEYGLTLVRHYRVFGQSAVHASLRGKFMAKLRSFTVWQEAEARWAGGRISHRSQLPAELPTLRSVRQQSSDDESPVCKARRAVSPATPRVPSSAASSTIVPSVTLYSGTAESLDLPALLRRPTVDGLLYCRCRCRFRSSLTGILCHLRVRSAFVATQPYPSSQSHSLLSVLTWTILLGSVPDPVTELFRCRRSNSNALVSVNRTPGMEIRPLWIWTWVSFSR